MFTPFRSCTNDKTRAKAAQKEGEPERSPRDRPSSKLGKAGWGKEEQRKFEEI